MQIEIGQEVVFLNRMDGYPDRARFVRMDGDRYLLRHRAGTLSVAGEDITDIVRPKPAVYAEVPVLPLSEDVLARLTR